MAPGTTSNQFLNGRPPQPNVPNQRRSIGQFQQRSGHPRGYTRGNGTYVAPSHATNPNRTQRDNYSARGNLNPYTGKAGTKPITR